MKKIISFIFLFFFIISCSKKENVVTYNRDDLIIKKLLKDESYPNLDNLYPTKEDWLKDGWNKVQCNDQDNIDQFVYHECYKKKNKTILICIVGSGAMAEQICGVILKIN